MNSTVSFEKFAFVYGVRFDKELRDLIGDVPRADEFIRGVEWVLCRNPEDGRLIVGEPHHIRVVFCGLYGYADVGVFYAVRGEHIHLLSVYNNGSELE